MVNTLKIPFKCAEGVGRLRYCTLIIFCARARYSALALPCAERAGAIVARARIAHQASDKSKASKVTVALEEIFRIQVHCKRLTVPETA
jgi:hypothetical protein